MIDPGGCVVANTEHVRSLLSDLDGFTAAEVIVNPLGVRVLVLQCVQAQGWPDRGVVTGQVHSGRTMACGTCRAAVCGWCAGTSGGCSATSVAAHGGPSSNARSAQLCQRRRLTGRLREALERALGFAVGRRRGGREYGCRGGASARRSSPSRPGSAAGSRQGCGCWGPMRPESGRCAGCSRRNAGDSRPRG